MGRFSLRQTRCLHNFNHELLYTQPPPEPFWETYCLMCRDLDTSSHMIESICESMRWVSWFCWCDWKSGVTAPCFRLQRAKRKHWVQFQKGKHVLLSHEFSYRLLERQLAFLLYSAFTVYAFSWWSFSLPPFLSSCYWLAAGVGEWIPVAGCKFNAYPCEPQLFLVTCTGSVQCFHFSGHVILAMKVQIKSLVSFPKDL